MRKAIWRGELYESSIESPRNNDKSCFFLSSLSKPLFASHAIRLRLFLFNFFSRIKIGISSFHIYPIDYEELRESFTQIVI